MTGTGDEFRFGSFEFSPQTGDLMNGGRRIRLQNQISRLLEVLLRQPGALVTREDLRTTLWPADTFVDFDRSLNKAVSELRSILRDTAAKPRFIETLPRRGYRFIGSVELSCNGGASLRTTQSGQLRKIRSLVVLPLVNVSGDPGEEYFSDGITAELIATLSRIASLRVISRTSAMRFKGTRKSLPAIAGQLHVDAAIEGTILRSAGRVRVTAQLVLASEDRHIWSRAYECADRDVIGLETELAQNIAEQIHQPLTAPANPVVASVDVEAYEAFLKGSYYRDRMTPPDIERSISCFQRATELHSGYAQAYAGLAQSYFFQGLFGVKRADEAFPKAKDAARRAVKLDDTLATAHSALAAVHILYDWDWAGAEAECSRAIQLSPGDPVGHVHLADYMSIQGRHDEAVARFRQALMLDPISRVYLGHFGLILYRARRYEEAAAQCRKALEVDPAYANAMWFLSLALEQQGNLSEAVRWLENATEISKGAVHLKALLCRACALVNLRERSLAILDDLESQSRTRYVSPFDLAVANLGLGNDEAALQLLEESRGQRVFRLIELTLPLFDSIRQNPRCQEILRCIGLADSDTTDQARIA